jgi:membrane protease YdiL (CAAX protease family)
MVAIGGVVALGPARRGLFAWPKVSARGLGLVLAGIAAGLVLAHLLALIWPLVLPIRSTYLSEGLGLEDAVLDFVVLAPVIEEIAFRGAILGALLRVVDRGAAVILTAFLFATIHLSPVSFGHLFLIGLLCAEVRLRSGSLYLPMAVHALYNAVVVAIDWLWLG